MPASLDPIPGPGRPKRLLVIRLDLRPAIPVSYTHLDVYKRQASPAVAQALVQGVGTLGASGAPGPTLRVHHTELAPLAEQDPRGAGIAMLALPLGIGGLIVGVLTALQVTGRRAKVVTILAASTLAGLGWTCLLYTSRCV